MILLGVFNIPTIQPETIELNEVEAQINQIRVENGLKSLNPSNCLRERASIRQKEVVELWSHTRPNGSRGHTAKDCGGTIQGENLAKYSKDVIGSWLESPTHKAIILNSRVTNIGIYTNGKYTVMEVNN